MTSAFAAVLFDFGGVFTDSPFHAVHDFGKALGIDAGEVTELVFGSYEHDSDHPWHRLERGEITLENARELILASSEGRGVRVDIYDLFARMAGNNAGADSKRALVERVRGLKAEGYTLGIITNNVVEFGDGWRGLIPVDELFDFVVDSSSAGMRKPDPRIYQLGMRKPDPRIYQLALAQLGGIEPQCTVYLDDYQANVDVARDLGMRGITVGADVETTIRDLDAVLHEQGGQP
jgi:epoxide hydrolase-like predicted phosphatase